MKNNKSNSLPYSKKFGTERRTGNHELQSIANAKGISKGVVLPADIEFKATINKELKNGFSDLENSKLNFLISFALHTTMYHDVLIEKLDKYKNLVYLEKISKQTGGNK